MSCDSLTYEDDDDDHDVMIAPGGLDDAVFTSQNFTSRPITLTPDEVKRRQEHDIISTSQVLSTTPDRAAVLLQRFDWKVEKLRDQWFEDPERVQRNFGISLESSEVLETPRVPQDPMCPICWDVESDTTTVTLSQCQHKFHKLCMRKYLLNEISTKASLSLCTTCPMVNCRNVCDREVFSHFFAASQPEVMDKYAYYRFCSYVENHSKYRWCPQCRNPVFYDDFVRATEKSHVVQCTSCNEEFCFSCGAEAHAPATCKQLRLWLQKERDESETANWVAANTKPCPQCTSTIEKNGGCNHMVCSQCKYEFCWICEDKWEKHGNSWYKCNFYEEKADSAKTSRDKAKRELERYIFYYSRYRTHDQSKKFESALYKKIKEKVVGGGGGGANGVAKILEMEYLEESARQLTQCRHMLKYTYVYAFYLHGVQGRELFEFNQDQLERQTEVLSGMIENSQKYDRTTIVTSAQMAKSMLMKLREGRYVEEE
eukprot:PhF_6_TR2324/c0_g1_i1/m.4130/K11968/ARIH1; ariadne-1